MFKNRAESKLGIKQTIAKQIINKLTEKKSLKDQEQKDDKIVAQSDAVQVDPIPIRNREKHH